MVVLCDRDLLDVQDVPPEMARRPQLGEGLSKPNTPLAGLALEDLERQAIVSTLAKTAGNREKAARILGIGERTLYRKIKEYNL
jgi:DNA-binding NtrC family response regulator